MTFKDLADKVDQMLYEIKRGSKKAIGYMECFYNFIPADFDIIIRKADKYIPYHRERE